MGNGLTLYDARNVSWEDTRGVVQCVCCGVVFPHRVLICPRDGCGRHAARQSGDLNHAELYCCVPCAQLEGHSDRCDRAYSSHTSVGGPSGTPPVDDTYSHGLDLAVCGFKSNGDDSGPDCSSHWLSRRHSCRRRSGGFYIFNHQSGNTCDWFFDTRRIARY